MHRNGLRGSHQHSRISGTERPEPAFQLTTIYTLRAMPSNSPGAEHQSSRILMSLNRMSSSSPECSCSAM
jgi:hypothetical protein